MPANQSKHRRPSGIQTPHPKRAKNAILHPFLTDEPEIVDVSLPEIRVQSSKQSQPSAANDARQERLSFRVPETPTRSRDLSGPSRSHIFVTPARRKSPMRQEQVGRGLSVIPGSAPRMLATPARPQARTVREEVNRFTPIRLGSLSSKATEKRSVHDQLPSMIGRKTATPGKTPVTVTSSFPAVALDDRSSPDSFDEDDENFEISKPIIISVRGRPRPLGYQAARKTNAQAALKMENCKVNQRSQNNRTSPVDRGRNDEGEEDDLYVDGDPEDILRRAHRMHNGNGSDGNLQAESEETDDLERGLCDILNALTIRELKLKTMGRLPFLRRNLRMSLDNLRPSQWYGHDRHAVRSKGISKVNVVYRLVDYELSGGSFSGKWFCPLCAIGMWFSNRGALDTHLYQYHTQCDYEWEEDEDDNSLLLRLSVPEVPDSDTEIGEDDEEEEEESTSEGEEGSSGGRTPSIRERSPPPNSSPYFRGSSMIRSTMPSNSPVKIQPSSPQLSSVHFVTHPTIRERPRPPRPIDPSNPERYPTPPPLDDLEGPASVHPHISGDAYSARPGGPKIFDILNELDMESFGLMKGFIIEKEEDVYELDKFRDEDKVMLVLWGRWIFLNRVRFTENYQKGVHAFIDEYWRMIHRVAGFAALRVFLLALVLNRFLTSSQYVGALRYYQELVGMGYWKPAEQDSWRTSPSRVVDRDTVGSMASAVQRALPPAPH